MVIYIKKKRPLFIKSCHQTSSCRAAFFSNILHIKKIFLNKMKTIPGSIGVLNSKSPKSHIHLLKGIQYGVCYKIASFHIQSNLGYILKRISSRSTLAHYNDMWRFLLGKFQVSHIRFIF